MYVGMHAKEGRNGDFLRSYRDEIKTRNWDEIPISSRIVPSGLSVAEGPYTALYNVGGRCTLPKTTHLLGQPRCDCFTILLLSIGSR